jgi:hypothetical protein
MHEKCENHEKNVSSRKKICWTGRKYVKGGEEKCEIKVEIRERKKNMMYS